MYEVGIIGIGRIGFLLEFDEFREKPCTHSGAYENHPDFKVTAVCDIDIENLTKYKKYSSNNEVLTYTDYNLMLVENKFDVISIATWTDTHEEIFYKCVDSKRVKLIFLEKPISLSYKRSEKMIKYAKLNNVYVVVDFERRWEGRYIKLKDIIKKKSLGQIRTVYGNVLAGGFTQAKWHKFLIKRGGPLLHDGVHLIDLILFLLGKPKKINSQIYKFCKKHKYEHTAYLNFLYSKKTNVFLEIGGRRKYFSFELDFQFENGRILIGNTQTKYFEVDKSNRYSGFYELFEKPFPSFFKKNYFFVALDEISNFFKNKNNVISSTGETALETMKIINKVSN